MDKTGDYDIVVKPPFKKRKVKVKIVKEKHK